MNAIVSLGSRTLVGGSVAVKVADNKQYLTFMLGGEVFAIGIL